jgi:hypothetical protein
MTRVHFRPKRLAWVVLPGDFTRYTIRLIRRAVARATREDPYFEFRVVQAPPPVPRKPACPSARRRKLGPPPHTG